MVQKSDRVQQQFVCACMLSHSVVSNSLQPHRLLPTRLLCPWDFPGKNTRVGCHFLLQGIFLTQGSNSHLIHQQADSLPHATWEALKQQLPSPKGYLDQMNKWAFPLREKPKLRGEDVSSCTHLSSSPYHIKPVGSQMLIPCSNSQALRHPVLL